MFGDDLVNRIIRYPGAIASRIRIMRLGMLGVRFGRKCWIRRIHVPRNPWDIVIDDMVALDDEVVLLTTGARSERPRLHIGRSTYVNRFTMFDASLSISVGVESMIGPFCYITDHDHGTGVAGPISAQALVEAPVKVGNNVWIGAHVVILKGVSIGDNAVIGAGAVVTTDVGPGERVAGVPARQIGAGRQVAGEDTAHGVARTHDVGSRWR
jgi:acetyltransferase-like isoleucine patch superfamily enzyme